MKDVYVEHVEDFDRMYIASYDGSSKAPPDAQTTAATISARMLWMIAIDKLVRQKAAQKRWFSTVTRVLDELRVKCPKSNHSIMFFPNASNQQRDKAPTEVKKLNRMKSKPASTKNANDALMAVTHNSVSNFLQRY
jgi:hypothetical protein